MKNKINFLFVVLLLVCPSVCFPEVKTFIKEYTYQASEDDSRNSSRITALREVKRSLLEEYSLTENKKKATQDLAKALKLHHDVRDSAKTDPAFDKIRNSPDFKRLVGK